MTYVGTGDINPEVLRTMVNIGGVWAVYENRALDSANLGHRKFLRVGEGCTYPTAPKQLPDTQTDVNWMYQHVGYVDFSGDKTCT